MTALPNNIKVKFYDAIIGDIELPEIEQWLYVNQELENYLSPDDYLDLISLNFNKKGAAYELRALLRKHIDPGEFETYRILKHLREALRKTDSLPYILMEFYDLYCRGYSFLQDLGLGFGLAVEAPTVDNSRADTWEELNPEQQKDLLNSFSPKLEECIKTSIEWIESGKIILTGEQLEPGYYAYVDLRTPEEKKSKLWL